MNAATIRTRAPGFATVVAILLLSAARLAGEAWIVPGAANTNGLNRTRFSTSLILVNSGVQDRKVDLGLVPGPGTERPVGRTYMLAAGATLTLENVLYAAWSMEGTGALRVSADGPIAVFARVSNLPDVVSITDVSFSSALPVIPEGALLESGSVGHSAWIAQSADAGGKERTNVAVAFPDEGGGAARIGIFDGKGSALATFTFETSQPAFLQKSLASLPASAAEAARVSVAVLRGRACAYTAAVDNVTGDLTVFPAEIAPSGPTSAIGNGVALTAGEGGAVWETEVHLFNPGTKAVTGNAILLGHPEASVDFFAVPAGATIAIRDVIGSRFHVSAPAVGAVLWNADGPLVIQTRTSAPSTGLWVGGTAGSGQRAVALSTFQNADEPPRDLADLSASFPERTNLLLVGGFEGGVVTMEAIDPTGRSLGSARRTLDQLGFAELPLSGLFAIPSEVPRLRIRIRVESGEADVQAAVVKRGNNDPIFYESFAYPIPTEPGPPLAAGVWGRADGLEGLRADETTITVERWCRQGSFPQPARLDAEGKFAVSGLYFVSIGPSSYFSAVLSGQVKGDTVTIAVFNAEDGRPLDSAGIFRFGRSYSVPTDACPVEYARIESPGRRAVPRPLAPRPAGGPGLVGTWGGDHVNLTIGMSGGLLEYDCAHGTIDAAFATDSEGRFDLAGTHVPEHPGPIEDKPPIVHPARYSGSTDGTTMTLTVTLSDTGEALGPYRLNRSTAARIVKCL